MNAEDLVIAFKRDMAKLSGTERRRAIESVRDVIRAAEFDDAAGSDYEAERCPRCGSAAVVKKGKSKNGGQRYLCRDCGRTFGMGSGRILGTSRLPRETWMAYAECLVLMLPLRECVRRCRVCLKTASTMRRRLIECLSAYSPSFKVERGCGCELDETYFPESFKGNHVKGSFAMPHRQRRDGRMVAPRYTRRGATMPSNIPATTIRIDPEVKKETTVILDEPGLSMSTAVNAFLRALVREGGMPFEMKVKSPAPDGETIGYKEYLRLAGLVANSPSTDLQALCSLDLRGHIHLNDVEKESLAQNGWLIYAGQEVLEFDSLSENDLQKSDDQLYKASKSAVSFVNLMRSKTDKGPI